MCTKEISVLFAVKFVDLVLKKGIKRSRQRQVSELRSKNKSEVPNLRLVTYKVSF